jgi:hypothetical protein
MVMSVMNTNLQKEILLLIKNMNEQRGVHYFLVHEKLVDDLVNTKRYSSAQLDGELKLLRDAGKIEFHDQNGMNQLPYRLTHQGYQEFDPWHTKVWRWFTNEMAKILSIVATALSIVSILVSLFSS